MVEPNTFEKYEALISALWNTQKELNIVYDNYSALLKQYEQTQNESERLQKVVSSSFEMVLKLRKSLMDNSESLPSNSVSLLKGLCENLDNNQLPF